MGKNAHLFPDLLFKTSAPVMADDLYEAETYEEHAHLGVPCMSLHVQTHTQMHHSSLVIGAYPYPWNHIPGTHSNMLIQQCGNTLCLFNHCDSVATLKLRDQKAALTFLLSGLELNNRGGRVSGWILCHLPGPGDDSMPSCSSCHCMVRW